MRISRLYLSRAKKLHNSQPPGPDRPEQAPDDLILDLPCENLVGIIPVVIAKAVWPILC